MSAIGELTVATFVAALAELELHALVVQRVGGDWIATAHPLALLAPPIGGRASSMLGALEALMAEVMRREIASGDGWRHLGDVPIASHGPTLCGEDFIGRSPAQRRQMIERVVMGDAPGVSLCSCCKAPAHASETDELDRCAACRPPAIECMLDTPNGPVVEYNLGDDADAIEAALPDGWMVDWHAASYKLMSGRFRSPLVSAARRAR